MRGLDPYPDSDFQLSGDPSSDTLVAPLTSATVDLLTRKLGWRSEGSYELANRKVREAWDFGRSPPESVSELRKIMATDRNMKLLVAHGLFDLATPYFGSQIVLDQLPPFASTPRVKLVVFPGGHMFYSRDASRHAFRAEVEALMK
ncbi:carboxypeptidase C (cathepsin A) [Bradyrhizobium sp. USDA 3364]